MRAPIQYPRRDAMGHSGLAIAKVVANQMPGAMHVFSLIRFRRRAMTAYGLMSLAVRSQRGSPH